MKQKPEYAKMQTYQLVSAFCKMLGVSIKYGNKNYAVAHVDETGNPYIEMPFDNRAFQKDMSSVLGHEISHFLVERLFNDIDYQSQLLNEYSCDMLGTGIYYLVDKIVDEAEANGEDLAEYIKQFIVNEIVPCTSYDKILNQGLFFPTPNIDKTLEFYVNILGFEQLNPFVDAVSGQ